VQPPNHHSAVDAAGQQVGEQEINAAGRDHVQYHGVGADGLRAILHQQTEFYTTLVTAYERQYKDVLGELGLLRREADIYQKGEQAQRRARQENLDKDIGDLRELVARQNRRWRVVAWWLGVLTAILAMALVAIGWLYWREPTAALLRLWLGGGLAILAGALRHP
jgi:hypothetical protein